MKNVILVATIILGISFASAQKIKDAEVPAAVKQSFEKKYPGSKVEKWEKEGMDFEAEFDLNKIESSAVFNTDGTFIELEQEIKTAALPKAATEYCAKNFAGYKLAEAAKITDAAGKVSFEAEMNKGKEHFDVIFDDKGNFVRKSDVETGKEDKD